MFYVRSNDGTKIAVYDLKPEGYTKTIVMVHGWPLSEKMFEYQKPILLKAGYRVVTMDLRGFGNSDESAGGYTYDQFAADLFQVVKELKLHYFVLFGFSMGGAVAAKYMSIYRGYGVSKLCLCSAAVPSYCKSSQNPYGASDQDTNRLIALGYQDRPALNQYFGSVFFARRHSQAFLNWNQNLGDSSSGIGEMSGLKMLRDENLFGDLKYIRVPTGIFHGKKDKVCAYEMGVLTQKNIKGSILYSFENGGHGVYYDALNEFNKKLLDFLEMSR